MRTTETLPDGNKNIVYTNEYGQVMLEVLNDPDTDGSGPDIDRKWSTYYRYDDYGRVVFRAEPSAVWNYDDTFADLMALGYAEPDNYFYLNDATGIITDYTYYPMTSFGIGGAPGRLSDIAIRTGENGSIPSGTKIPQSHTTYLALSHNGTTIYLDDIVTSFAALNSGEPQDTNYGYQATGLQITYKSIQNSAGEAYSIIDAYGRTTWHRDAGGFIHYTEYDILTGAISKTIADVNTSLVTGQPGWFVTPAGGGAHIVTTYELDSLGRPTKITDPNNNVTHFAYNDAAHEVRIYEGVIPGSNWPTKPILVVRDDRPKSYSEVLTMATTPTVVGGVFTGNEPIASVQSLSRTFVNSGGQVTSVRDYFQLDSLTYTTAIALGTLNEHYYERTLAYDNRGRENRVKRGDGTIYRTVYDGLGRPTSEWIGTDDTGWSETNPAGMTRIQAYVYDNGGAGDSHLTSQTDALNRTTTYGYDFRGRLASTTLPDPDGDPGTSDVAVYRTDYDNLGRVIATTDATGLFNDEHQTQYSYMYNLLDPVSNYWMHAVSALHPDPDGTGPLERPATYKFYEPRGLLVQASTGDVTNLRSYLTNYAYDGAGRLISTTEPDANPADAFPSPKTTHTYDDAGNLLTTTDSRGAVTTNTYDRANRLENVIAPDPDGANPLLTPITYYGYDLAGNLASLTDPNSNVTSWLYDALGRAKSETNALGKTRSYEYDAAGRLKEKTDRNGRLTRYEYNHFDQMTAENWYDGEYLLRTLSYWFDAAGQLNGTSDPTAIYTYVPDQMGRVKSQTQSIGGLTSGYIEFVNEYNTNSFRTSLTAKIGGVNDFQNTFAYDNLQRLTSLVQQDNGGNAVAPKRVDFAYHANGQLEKLSRYAGTTTSDLVASTYYGYDGFARLNKLTHNQASLPLPLGEGWGEGILAGYQFDYESNSSRIAEIDSYTDGLTTYGYDNTNQLTSANHAGPSDEAYAYDPNGNRSAHDIGPNNQLLSDGTYAYAYDAEGNRIRRTDLTTSKYTKYEYDHRNRLINIVEVDPLLAGGAPSSATSELNPVSSDVMSALFGPPQSEYYVDLRANVSGSVEGGNVVLTFDIDIYGNAQLDNFDVQYQIHNASAIHGSDYTAPAGSQQSWQTVNVAKNFNHVIEIPTTPDSTTEILESFTVLVRLPGLPPEADPQELVLQARIWDAASPYSGSFTATALPAVEGDSVVLSVVNDTELPLLYYVEDLSAVEGVNYTGPTSLTPLGASGQVELPTESDGEYHGTLIFRIHVLVAGDWSSAVTLDAYIFDWAEIQFSSLSYEYDTHNQLIHRLKYSGDEYTSTYFAYENGQIVLQFDGPFGAVEPSHRYLWGPQVDQLLADEAMTALIAEGDVLWPLGDHLGTLRDLAVYDDVASATTVANHRTYDTFGNLLAETNAAIDELFGYTGRLWDKTAKLQNNHNRIYDPLTGQFITQDPISFAGGDNNLMRYVGNRATMSTDPTGLADPAMAWNWHHMLDQAIFTQDFMGRHGLDPNMINSAEYGWMMRAQDHLPAYEGSIHRQGWGDEWKNWIKGHEENGTKITKDMIDNKLIDMKSKFKLADRGFSTKFCYNRAKSAYKAAEAASRLARGVGGASGGKGSGIRGRALGFGIGFGIGFFSGVANGSENPVADGLESLDPFDPSTMGHSDDPLGMQAQWEYDSWMRYQNELNHLDAQRRSCPNR